MDWAEYGEQFWKPEHGPAVALKTMDIQWLRNVARHLEQRRKDILAEESAGGSVLGMLQGEMAIDAVESSILSLGDAAHTLRGEIDELLGYIEWREKTDLTMHDLGRMLEARAG